MKADKELVKLTKDLIRFESIKSKPRELDKIRDFCAKWLKGCGKIRKFEFKGKPCLFTSLDGSKKPKILLTGHLDVVEGEKYQFTPKVRGNKIFGRGAVDMKSGVAVYMVLFKELAKISKSGKKKLPVGLMLTCDEEIGGHRGAGSLANKGFGGKFVLASEPNKSHLGKFSITIKEKGVVWLKVKAKGKATHGSKPWEGENAADKLIETYLEIKKIFPKLGKNTWKTTCNLGKISSGDAPNRVPDSAEMVLDIRWVNNLTSSRVLAEVRKIVKNKKGVSVEVVKNEPMLKTNPKNKYIQNLKRVAENIDGKKVKLISEPGASDVRFFSDKGMASAVFGPHGKNYHGLNEFVYISSMKKLYRIMEEFIQTNI